MFYDLSFFTFRITPVRSKGCKSCDKYDFPIYNSLPLNNYSSWEILQRNVYRTMKRVLVAQAHRPTMLP